MSYAKFVPYLILLALAAPTAVPLAVSPASKPLPRVDGLNADYLDGLSSEDILLSVDAEAIARIAADNAEAQARMDADAAEAAERAAADSTLNAAIQQEAADRASALAAEGNARTVGDAALNIALQAEANDRAGGDAQMLQALLSEAQVRAHADNVLQTAIAVEGQARHAAIQSTNALLSAEIQDRLAEDATHTSMIGAEAQARAANDQALQTSVTLERNSRIAGDNAILAQMLRVVTVTGHLTNAATFGGAGTFDPAPANLHYTNVLENTAPEVIEMLANGGIYVKKAGIITVTANFDAITWSSYAELHGYHNGVLRMKTLGQSAGADHWVQISGTMTRSVAAGDLIEFRAIPQHITSMDNGHWSTLSVAWMGVN